MLQFLLLQNSFSLWKVWRNLNYFLLASYCFKTYFQKNIFTDFRIRFCLRFVVFFLMSGCFFSWFLQFFWLIFIASSDWFGACFWITQTGSNQSPEDAFSFSSSFKTSFFVTMIFNFDLNFDAFQFQLLLNCQKVSVIKLIASW